MGLLLFSTCFRQLCVHHQEKIPYLFDTWYLSLYIDDCLVCRAEFIPPCIPDSHLYTVTNTRCRIGTVFSSDDGHIIAWNMKRKAINILRKFVHQFGSIYKRLCKDAQTTKHKITVRCLEMSRFWVCVNPPARGLLLLCLNTRTWPWIRECSCLLLTLNTCNRDTGAATFTLRSLYPRQIISTSHNILTVC